MSLHRASVLGISFTFLVCAGGTTFWLMLGRSASEMCNGGEGENMGMDDGIDLAGVEEREGGRSKAVRFVRTFLRNL